VWQITSRSRGRGHMIFMPQMLNFLIFFARFARYFIWNKNLIRNMAKKSCYKYNNLYYNRKHVKWFYYSNSLFIEAKCYGWTLLNVVCLVTWHLLTFYGMSSSDTQGWFRSLHWCSERNHPWVSEDDGMCAGNNLYVTTCI